MTTVSEDDCVVPTDEADQALMPPARRCFEPVALAASLIAGEFERPSANHDHRAPERAFRDILITPFQHHFFALSPISTSWRRRRACGQQGGPVDNN